MDPVPDRIAPGLGTLDLVGLLRALRTAGAPDPLLEMEFFPSRRDAQAEAQALDALRRLDRDAAA